MDKQFYYVDKSGSRQGPMALTDLPANEITPDTLVWCKGMPDWMKAGEVDELKEVLQKAADIDEPPVLPQRPQGISLEKPAPAAAPAPVFTPAAAPAPEDTRKRYYNNAAANNNNNNIIYIIIGVVVVVVLGLAAFFIVNALTSRKSGGTATTTEQPATTEQSSTSGQTTEAAKPAEGNTYRFKGYVCGKYEIRGEFTIDGNKVHGKYYYQSTMRKYGGRSSTYIGIDGTLNGTSMSFTGSFSDGKLEYCDGHFEGKPSDFYFSGTLRGDNGDVFDITFKNRD